MSDSTTPAATAGPPPSVDVQDPLPEPNWLWRRVFVFAVSAAILAFVWLKVDAVADVARGGSETAISGLVKLLRLQLYLLGGLIMLYLVAPSAEQITKMVQVAKSLRGGVSFATTSSATDSTGSTATSTSVASQAAPIAAPVALPVVDEADEPDAAPTNAGPTT